MSSCRKCLCVCAEREQVNSVNMRKQCYLFSLDGLSLHSPAARLKTSEDEVGQVNLFCGFTWEKKGKVRLSLISVSIQTESKTRLVREVGARAGNPPPALALSRSCRARAASRKSLWPRARSPTNKQTRRGLTLLFFPGTTENQNKQMKSGLK